jgi:hypothetical protein
VWSRSDLGRLGLAVLDGKQGLVKSIVRTICIRYKIEIRTILFASFGYSTGKLQNGTLNVCCHDHGMAL